VIPGVLEWLSDPAHWSGPDGVPARTVEHLWYSAVSLLIASVVAIPAAGVPDEQARGDGDHRGDQQGHRGVPEVLDRASRHAVGA